MSAQKSKSKSKKGAARGGADLLVPGSHPAVSLAPAFAYFAQGAGAGPDITREAYTQFVRALGLAGCPVAADVQRAFVTWFLLEYRLSSGKTPLAHYALCAPRRTAQERVQAEVMRQVADTSRFGLFWVRAADASLGTLELDGAHDGAAYTVHDRACAARVAEAPGFESAAGNPGRANLLAAHLAQVAEEWRLPAGILAIRCDVDEAAFASTLEQTRAAGQQIGFMDMAIAEFGRPGAPAGQAAPGAAAAASAEGEPHPFWELPKGAPAPAPDAAPMQLHRPAPRVVLDGPASEVPGMTVPPERREGALMDAARLYGLLARDFSLVPTWADIVEAVRNRADGEEAGDVVRRLFGPNAEALAPLDDAAFEDLLYCVILAWNLLPHDVFDGKSPAEVYNGR